MGLIEMKTTSAAPVDVVYNLAHSVRDFVYAMPNIKDVRRLDPENDPSFARTRWILDVPLPAIFGELSWVKDAFWDDAARTCDIRLSPSSRGVVKGIDGAWAFTPCDQGTLIQMRMTVTVNHPLIGHKTRETIDTLMKKNIQCLMQAIAERAEQHAAAPSRA